MKFLKTSDPILRKIAKEIPLSEINSKETQKIIKKMMNIAYGERSDRKRPIMVGLAAPQIGISKQIILVAVGATKKKVGKKRKIGKLKVYINPKIIWSSKSKETWYEGCYSIPGVYGIVPRSSSIKIKALSLKKITHTLGADTNQPPRLDEVVEQHSGFTARIFQHEIDHLNGKFYITHIKDPNHIHKVKPKEHKLYRKNWKNWPKKCSFEKWHKIKN